MPNAPLLIIEWDGADFRAITAFIKREELPHLSQLRRDGVYARLTPAYPAVPPVLWNTVVTGQYADRHGVLGADTTRRVPALWETVAATGQIAHAIGDLGGNPPDPATGIYVGAEHISHVAEPLASLPEYAPNALATLTLTANEIDPAIVRLFVSRAHEIDQSTDNRLTFLTHVLANVFTRHNYATLAVEAGFALAVIRYDFLRPLTQVFGKTNLSSVWADVLPGAYRLLDLFLGRLMALASDAATVLLYSPHGVETEPQVFAPGFSLLRGTDIRQGETLYGATLYDIAPTALTLLGLPVAGDLVGRVWREAWHVAPDVRIIPVADSTPPLPNLPNTHRWNLAQVYAETGRPALAVIVLRQLFAETLTRWALS